MDDLAITLPEDAHRIEQLQKKLEEYRARLRKYVQEHDLARDYATECKLRILDQLLKQKIVRLSELEHEYSENDPKALPYVYNAFVVIQDYALTGGQNVDLDKGTGLPK
jgi:hypothetical protein